MAKRRVYKKKIYKKKHYSGKKSGTNKIVKAINTGNGLTYLNRFMPKYNFTRSDIQYAYLNPIAGQNSTGGIFTFRLGGIPGYAEYVNLFQKYRINKVKLIFNLISTLGPSSVQPILYVCKNLEPSNQVQPTQSIMEQQSGVTVMQFSNEHRTFSKSFYPYIATRTLTSATTAQDVIEFTDRRRAMWIDCNDVMNGPGTGVIHHGLKWFLDWHTTGVAENDFEIEVHAEYSLSFKGTD